MAKKIYITIPVFISTNAKTVVQKNDSVFVLLPELEIKNKKVENGWIGIKNDALDPPALVLPFTHTLVYEENTKVEIYRQFRSVSPSGEKETKTAITKYNIEDLQKALKEIYSKKPLLTKNVQAPKKRETTETNDSRPSLIQWLTHRQVNK